MMIHEIWIPREWLGLPREVEAAIANSKVRVARTKPEPENPAVSLVRVADALERCADRLSRIASYLEAEDE
jgi:hypothetical protein